MAGAPPKGGLSLYDNLLDPKDKYSSATISSAPVLYNQGSAAAAADNAPQKLVNPALRFQPIRRPVAKQPSKPKAAFPKSIPKPTEHVEAPEASAAAAAAPAQPARTTAADWAATEEDEWRYGSGEKRQRGGRKKKKRRQEVQTETDWDELYDPSRPTNVEEYLRSDEKVAEVREWKALLYRHKKNDESDMSEDEDSRPILDSMYIPTSSSAINADTLWQTNSLPHRPTTSRHRRLNHRQLSLHHLHQTTTQAMMPTGTVRQYHKIAHHRLPSPGKYHVDISSTNSLQPDSLRGTG